MQWVWGGLSLSMMVKIAQRCRLKLCRWKVVLNENIAVITALYKVHIHTTLSFLSSPLDIGVASVDVWCIRHHCNSYHLKRLIE